MFAINPSLALLKFTMKKIDPNITVYTNRLILQPVSDKYKFEICNEFTAEITKYMPFTPAGDIKATEDFIARSNDELISGKSVQFCIVERKTNEFLGCCGLHHTDTKAVELGLWLKKSVHGNGYGTEVVKALIALAEKSLDPDYLFYPVDKNNEASRKIPEKLGFIPFKVYEKRKNETVNLNVIEFRKEVLK
jgi:ribosomal-protein-alanine N-acetyltransferase